MPIKNVLKKTSCYLWMVKGVFAFVLFRTTATKMPTCMFDSWPDNTVISDHLQSSEQTFGIYFL